MDDFRDLYTVKVDKIEDLFKYLYSTSNELTLWRGQSNSNLFITSSFFRFYENFLNKILLITSIEQIIPCDVIMYRIEEQQLGISKDFIYPKIIFLREFESNLKTMISHIKEEFLIKKLNDNK